MSKSKVAVPFIDSTRRVKDPYGNDIEIDYPVFRKQIGDMNPESRWYGPHTCDGCGYLSILKHAIDLGAESYETPCMGNGYKYTPHYCTQSNRYRRLAGKVLTVIDACFPPESRQLKAIKDILKKTFAETIAEARSSQGDTSCESSDNFQSEDKPVFNT